MLLRNKRTVLILIWCVFCSLVTLPIIFFDNEDTPPLLIISFDGFRWDYLNRTSTPNFDYIISNGVHAKRGMINVFSTSTLTNHWSIVTGLYAESHGIIDNHFFDPVVNKTFTPLYQNRFVQNDPRFYDTGAEPIWVTNQLQKKQGRSGTIMWWGAENMVKQIRPTYHMPYDLSVESTYKINTIVEWFSSQSAVNLGLLYFSEPDHTAHQFGPDSENVTQMIRKSDELTGYLLKQLSERDLLDDINIIITSDHGFASTSKERLIFLDKYVDPSWYTMIHYTPVAAIIPQEGKEDIIFEKLKAASVTNHFTVYRKRDIPDRFHYRNNIRITPIIAVADITYNFISRMPTEKFKLAGAHGYDNQHEDMHPFFLAMGPSFKTNFQVEKFHMVDLYPLMCHLLHLRPAPNNGSMEVVSQLLREGHQNGSWTVLIYVVCLIVIASVGGVFAVTPFWHQCYLKCRLTESGTDSSLTLPKHPLYKDNSDKVHLLHDEEAAAEGKL